MSNRPRAVITGIGGVTPIGFETSFWPALLIGQNGVGRISHFDPTDYDCQIAGEVKNFRLQDFLPITIPISIKDERRMDPVNRMALAAAIMALKDADLKFPFTEQESLGTGVIVGTVIGGMTTYEKEHKVFLQKGARKVSPVLIPMFTSNMTSGTIANHIMATGPNFSPNSACATGTHAIGIGYQQFLLNIFRPENTRIKRMIVGGAEAPITPLAIAAFTRMGALTTSWNHEPERASRPFDKDRNGLVMSEGAVILVLEDLEEARVRNAKIYCEVAGYAATADAYHLTAPHPKGRGARDCMRLALEDARINPEDVDYINVHGCSTPRGDKIETFAIKEVFREHAYKVPVSSSKSITGHLFAAGGPLGIAAAAFSIYNGTIHPTINYETPDPDCDLDYVPNVARKVEIEYAMTNSFGFGGQNAVIILKKYHE